MIELKKIKKKEDLSQVAAIYQAAFAELLAKYQDTETNPAMETEAELFAKYERESNDFYFILHKSKIIGSIRVITDGRIGRIAPIAVFPEFQGHGFGKRALLRIEQEYPTINKWQLDTIKEEPYLISLYKKMGYTFTGKEENLANMTIVYMEKNLKNVTGMK